MAINFCYQCGAEISKERKSKRARTCSKACGRQYRLAYLKDRRGLYEALKGLRAKKDEASSGNSVREGGE